MDKEQLIKELSRRDKTVARLTRDLGAVVSKSSRPSNSTLANDRDRALAEADKLKSSMEDRQYWKSITPDAKDRLIGQLTEKNRLLIQKLKSFESVIDDTAVTIHKRRSKHKSTRDKLRKTLDMLRKAKKNKDPKEIARLRRQWEKDNPHLVKQFGALKKRFSKFGPAILRVLDEFREDLMTPEGLALLKAMEQAMNSIQASASREAQAAASKYAAAASPGRGAAAAAAAQQSAAAQRELRRDLREKDDEVQRLRAEAKNAQNELARVRNDTIIQLEEDAQKRASQIAELIWQLRQQYENQNAEFSKGLLERLAGSIGQYGETYTNQLMGIEDENFTLMTELEQRDAGAARIIRQIEQETAGQDMDDGLGMFDFNQSGMYDSVAGSPGLGAYGGLDDYGGSIAGAALSEYTGVGGMDPIALGGY